VITALIAVAPRGVSAQTISVVNATEKVYQADSSLPHPTSSAILYAAQNEFEAFQIVVQGPASNVSVTANALAGPAGSQIVPSTLGRQGDIMVYREAFITLPSSGGLATDPAAKQGNAPDALIPQYDEFYQEARNASVPSVASGQNAVYFVDIHVPQTAPAGIYRGSVTVSANGVATAVPVTLTVWPFALPSTPSLKVLTPFAWNAATTQYPSLSGQCCNDVVAQMHLLHAIEGVNHRVTVHAFDYGSANLTSYANNFGALINGRANTLLSGAHPTMLEYLGPHGANNTLSSWRTFFSQNGWLNYLVDYAADEPAFGANSNWCTLMANAANDTAAGVRSMTTASIGEARTGTCTDPSSPYYRQPVNLSAINIFTPVVDQVQPLSMGAGQTTMGDYASWRAGSLNGVRNEVWEYQSCDSWGCTGPGTSTGWPSYAIDHGAIRSRALEWISFRNGITGEYYWESSWAWVYLTRTPWTNQYASGGNGDGTLIYPGVAATAQVGGTHDIPLASLRLKMLREGVEDYEYMAILGQLADTNYANTQIDKVFATAHSVTPVNASSLHAARYNLACRIVVDQHPTWTCDPSTWGGSSTAANVTLTVNLAGTGSGGITSTPAGINCGATASVCSAQFPPGTSVSLTATADPGSSFTGFSGGCTSATPGCTLALSSSQAVVGSFGPCGSSDCFSRPDSASLGGNWNTVSGAMQITSNQATNSLANTVNASVWLTSIGADQDVAVDCKVAGPGNNCGLMTRWSDTNNHYYSYVDAGQGAIHLWRVQAGAFTRIGAATRTIAAGTAYHLRQVIQGSLISVYFNWETAPAITATDTALAAGNYGGLHAYAGAAGAIGYSSFDIKPMAPSPHLATVTKSGTGKGTVTSVPAGISCGANCSSSFPGGTSITLTAVADPGSTFSGFTGGCSSSSASCTFTLAADASVNAAFALNDFSISASPQSISLEQGSSAAVAISTAVISGAAQAVALSAAGLPAGTTASFNPGSLTAGSSATMTIAVASTTPAGTYAFTIVGTGTTTTRTFAASLRVVGRIAFRGMSTYVSQSASTMSMDLIVPPSAQANDTLLAFIFIGDYFTDGLWSPPDITAPPGWTLLSQASDGNAGLLQVYSRVAVAWDAGTTYSWTTWMWVGANCSLLAYSGATSVDASAAQDNPYFASTYSTPAVTTTSASDMLVAAYAAYSWNSPPPGSWSAPAGMAQRVNLNNGGLLTLSNDDAIQSAAGWSGAFSATATPSQNYALTALVALRR
jgi:hypothetical protein